MKEVIMEVTVVYMIHLLGEEETQKRIAGFKMKVTKKKNLRYLIK